MNKEDVEEMYIVIGKTGQHAINCKTIVEAQKHINQSANLVEGFICKYKVVETFKKPTEYKSV